MRIGSLFSGIGGLELGLEWAGVGHTIWQVEWKTECRGWLARHWPDAVRHTDVRLVGARNLAPVDVICGGYPCQPFSVAGNRLGEDDERHLWPEFARILGEMVPAFAVLENVPAHLSLGFGTVLGDLSDLGYDAEWQTLSARSVGAPHLRERVFVLAHHRSQRVEGDGAEPLPWVSGFQGFQDVGGVAALRGRSDIPEPLLWRVSDGVPSGVDRLHAIGNAVVPHVAQIVGRRLLALHAQITHESSSPRSGKGVDGPEESAVRGEWNPDEPAFDSSTE